MEKGTVAYGAMQAVENCTRVQPKENVVIITDDETEHIGEALYDAACRASLEGRVSVHIMEDFGPRPEDGGTPLPFPDALRNALSTADVSFYAASGKKGELQSFRTPMTESVGENSKLRHAHMISITDKLMQTGMAVDYAVVQDVTAKVNALVRQAERIRVTSPAGTDFIAHFNPAYRWKISDGLIRPEDWSNLPDGETFTCVGDIPEGIIVVDGILGDYMSQKYGIITDTPMTLEIEDGRVMSMSCDNDKLLQELREYALQDENANRIGEFAIGTNVGLTELVGNLLQDEKFPGVHVAIGHGYPKKTGATWNSKAHCDAVLKDVTVDVEDHTLMKDGVFVDL